MTYSARFIDVKQWAVMNNLPKTHNYFDEKIEILSQLLILPTGDES
jgi:hypothetical protein